MKFLFASLPSSMRLNSVPPGFAIVATVAKAQGLDVSVLLADRIEKESEFTQRVLDTIRRDSVDVVCIGAMSSEYPHVEVVINNAGAEALEIGALRPDEKHECHDYIEELFLNELCHKYKPELFSNIIVPLENCDNMQSAKE